MIVCLAHFAGHRKKTKKRKKKAGARSRPGLWTEERAIKAFKVVLAVPICGDLFCRKNFTSFFSLSFLMHPLHLFSHVCVPGHLCVFMCVCCFCLYACLLAYVRMHVLAVRLKVSLWSLPGSLPPYS